MAFIIIIVVYIDNCDKSSWYLCSLLKALSIEIKIKLIFILLAISSSLIYWLLGANAC